MSDSEKEIRIPTVNIIKHLLEPILKKLDHIDLLVSNNSVNNSTAKYYRNNDLKKIFGLSSNTIVKYRETGVLPYTKLGEIFLYKVKDIDLILKENSIKF
jgi:hypothetical protein